MPQFAALWCFVGGGGGGGERNTVMDEINPTPFVLRPSRVHQSLPEPDQKCAPPKPNRELEEGKGFIKTDPGENHYYAGELDQTR